MNYQITLANHLKVLAFHIFGTSLMLIPLYFLHFDYRAVNIFLITWIVYTIPTLYLHFEYFLKNKGQQLTVSAEQLIFTDANGNRRGYKFDDLQEVVLYKSASLDKGGIQFLPIESYHYAQIIPKEGEPFFLSCLMAPDVEKAVSQIKWVHLVRKKRGFASMNFSLKLLPDN